MKAIIISCVVVVVLIGGVFFLGPPSATQGDNNTVNNVSIVDGKQIIEIKVRGGYQPRTSIAKPGIPTILRFKTGGTFDCSSSVRIPSKNISKLLPQTGSTDIDIGTNQLGTLQGTCGMGMYPFEVEFKS